MKNALLKCVAGLALAVSHCVSAAPLTDTVTIGSQEWAQVNLFTNVSWNTLNSQCPGGVCSLSSAINGYDLAGWTWADIDTVQALFNAFTGQATPAPGSYSETDSTFAPSILSLFAPTVLFNGTYPTEQVLGLTSSEHSTGSNLARAGNVIDYTYPGWVDVADTSTSYTKTVQDSHLGAWFLRDAPTAPVPAPATLALFGLGLVSLWATRRKRGAKL